MTTQIKPEQIRWRVGSISKDQKKGMLLGYIDSRTAMELLDAEDAAWSDEYRIVKVEADEGVECALTVNGVTRTDVGVPSNTEGLKGAYSDSLKRAAVKHGIGRELYELPRIWVTLDEYKRPTTTPTFRNGRWTLPSGSGSVFYDHEPIDQPQGGQRNRADGSGSGRTRPAAQYRRGELAALMGQHGLNLAVVEAMATHAGVPESERPMSDASIDKLIDHIIEVYESPSDGVGTPSTVEGASESAVASGAPPTPSSEAATVPDSEGDGFPPASTSERAPDSPGLLDAVLEATGGQLVPPKPGSDEYRALPTAQEKAQARAYWQRNEVPA